MATSGAGQTPSGARPNEPHMGRPVPGAGRPLEPAGNRGRRQITAPASCGNRIRLTSRSGRFFFMRSASTNVDVFLRSRHLSFRVFLRSSLGFFCFIPLARFLIFSLGCGGNLPRSSSGMHGSLSGVVPSFREVRGGIRGAFRESLRLFPSDRQGRCREVS